MILPGMIVIAALLILLSLFILMSSSPNLTPTYSVIDTCEDVSGESWKSILVSMNQNARPPTSQPVYTMFRNVPKDTITSEERKYCKQAVQWFSTSQLDLIDIDHLDWMAKDEQSPVIALLDGRVKVSGTTEVIRVIMMWCESTLWTIHPANAKGCFRPKA